MQANAAQSALDNLSYLPDSESIFAVSAPKASFEARLRLISFLLWEKLWIAHDLMTLIISLF